jgi:hypothetical protein
MPSITISASASTEVSISGRTAISTARQERKVIRLSSATAA